MIALPSDLLEKASAPMQDRQLVLDWYIGRLPDARIAESADLSHRNTQVVLNAPAIKAMLVGGGRGSWSTRRVPPKARNLVPMIATANTAGIAMDLAIEIFTTFLSLSDTVNRVVDFDPISSGKYPLMIHEPGGGYTSGDIVPLHIATRYVLPCRDVRNLDPSEGDVLYVAPGDWRPDPATGVMHIERAVGLPPLDLIPLTPGLVYQGEIDPLGLWLPTNTRQEATPWDEQIEIIDGRWIYRRVSDPNGLDILNGVLNGARGGAKDIRHRYRLLGEIADKSVRSLRGADDEAVAAAAGHRANFRSKLSINLSLAVRRMKRRALGLKVDGERVRTSWHLMPTRPFPEEPMSQAEIDEKDFFRKWTRDEAGNRVLVGLTKAETDEFESINARKQGGEDHQVDRWLELVDRHEVARLRRIGKEIEARQGNSQ